MILRLMFVMLPLFGGRSLKIVEVQNIRIMGKDFQDYLLARNRTRLHLSKSSFLKKRKTKKVKIPAVSRGNKGISPADFFPF